MEKIDQINFLNWLYNRFHYKYNYPKDSFILYAIDCIIQDIKPKPYIVDISQEDLDKILSKYYVDFNLDRTSEMNIGFSNVDRQNLRTHTKNIVNDVVNKIIPQDILIKKD